MRRSTSQFGSGDRADKRPTQQSARPDADDRSVGEPERRDRGVVTVAPAGEGTRIRSLAAMARALGRSESLFRLLETAAEEARVAIDASSVSVSRLVPGTLTVRTLLNVGELGPDEQRYPENETYEMQEFANLELVLSEMQTWVADVRDPDLDLVERDLLEQLGKGSSLGAPIVVDGHLWGEFYATRHVGDAVFD